MNNIYGCMYIGMFFVTAASGFNGQALHQYMWANYYQFEGDYAKAATWYNELFMHDAPVHVYKGYLMLLNETGAHAKIVGLLPIVEKKFERDADVQLLLAQALDKVGQSKQAHEKILNLAKAHTTHPEIVFQAVHLYVQRKEPDNALKALDTFLDASPRKNNNFIFYFMKSQIYLQQGNKEQALAQVKQCLDMHPGFGKGWLMLALLEEQEGRLDQAIKGYTTYLETDGADNKQIQQHLVELAFRQQIVQKKSDLLVANKSPFDKALHFLDTKEYKKAVDAVDEALAQKPDDQRTRLLKITILSAMQNQLQAAEILKTWLLIDPNQFVWLDSLHLLCRTGLAHQKAIAILEDVNKRHPKELLPLLYLIDISTRVSSSDSVLRYYTKALELTADARLKARLYFHMSHVHYKHNNYNAMRDALEKGDALGVDFPHVQNMLAYYYATESRDLDRAQQLITGVLAKHKSNPHFQDTQAFIYYKQHKYAQALAILEPVAEKIPNNFDVIKHLGKTYFKLGHKDKAVTTLERARSLAESDHEKQKCNTILGCWNAST